MEEQVEVPKLNAGQIAAAEGFFEFLFSDKTELNISGPGGVGKTFLMGHMIDSIIPRYHQMCSMMGTPQEYDTVMMLATTNKAAEVLAQATGRETSTVASFLNLRVHNDFETGETSLQRTNKWVVHQRLIIFIDEASMVDRDLLRYLREGTQNCKLIFVGDHCQLSPIKEPISKVYTDPNIPMFELTEPMRNREQPALQAICEELRRRVPNTEFGPIPLVPGVIDQLWGDDIEQAIESVFMDADPDASILAYTNDRVSDYNHHIRQLRGLSDGYNVGEWVVNNNAGEPRRNERVSVEEEFEILRVSDTSQIVYPDPSNEDVTLEVISVDLRSKRRTLFDILVPVDKAHHAALIKYYARIKKWAIYFKLKEQFLDLRPRSSRTVHKSQGSTHDIVFIDLEDISTCRQPNQVARLLYVGFSRAKSRVILYGNLAPKYGEIIE